MALKVYDAAEAVPEGLRGDYAKAEDGKFRPVIEAGKDDPYRYENVAGLRGALSTERSERERLAGIAKAFEGLDPAKAREAQKKLDEMRDWTPADKAREAAEAREKALAEKFGKETAAEKARGDGLLRELERALLDSQVAMLVQKHKGFEGAAEALLPHVRARTKVEQQSDGSFRVRVLGEDGKPAITQRPGKTGDMDLDEQMESLTKHPVFGRFFEGSGAAGSGTQGAGRAGSVAGQFTMKDSEVRANPRRALAMRDAATKAGQTFEIIEG